MKYIMKQKFWSWGDSFSIQDEHERDVYLVKGKVFSWGDNLSLQDMNGGELVYISQKLLSWKPRYEIYRNDVKFAEVVKEFSWWNSRFTLDVPGPNDYTITGSFWENEYVFERQGREVAWVSKKLWSWTDSYGIDIIEGEDDAAILATCIVIDLVCHDEDSTDE